MSETERAIEYVRRAIADFRIKQDAPAALLLAEYDRLKAELARLTTLRPASERPKAGERVLCWRRKKPFCVEREVLPGEEWTSLPTPREKGDDHEPQE